MRNAFTAALVQLAATQEFLFFTGDLGFMALEPLQLALGKNFINAGVAEQNMVGAAAGAASEGLLCWAYSIAPFVYARPFEQIRNDVCHHAANVKLVGNGGGYGYGVMGATHHALEDYGILACLPHMHIYVPAFAEDLAPVTAAMAAHQKPAYLRLGRCEKPKDFILPAYAPWRCLLAGEAGVLVVTGPGAGGMIAALSLRDVKTRPALWVATELPFATTPPPEAFWDSVQATGKLAVLEEHVAQGSAGQMLAYMALSKNMRLRAFRHFCAKGYMSGRYGSQNFHRLESGIDAESVAASLCGDWA
jgi:transketolase